MIQKTKHTLLVGTSKGLVIWRKKNKNWKVTQVHFRGMPVSVVYVDPRSGHWWVGVSHRHWGQKLHLSKDEGKSWEELTPPIYPQHAKLSSGKPAVLKKIWAIQQAGPDKPNGIWIGTEPGGLFFSNDNGQQFHLVESLWNHPSRLNENQWFGAGRDHPFLHSIVVDPRNSDHVYIGVSCAGVFETKDGGKTWKPRNKGLKAAYLPNPNVEIGHDPHRLLISPANPDVLWQQNHCGIFRSENGGNSWEDVSGPNGIAHYGFTLTIDKADPNRAWVVPALSDEERIAVDLGLCVCRTDDGGKSWNYLRKGLPQDFCFDIVLRHSMDSDGKTLAFGTSNGNLYVSVDAGESWNCLSSNLARVESVTFAL